MIRVLVSLMLLLGCADAIAVDETVDRPPPVVLPRTEVRYLPWVENGVNYRIQIALSRDMSGDKHPVIVVLDADYAFAIARNIVDHLSDCGDIVSAIVVGVGYEEPTSMQSYRRNRSRDYTPVSSESDGYGPEYTSVEGGAVKFADFLEHALMPMLEHDYHISSKRMLVGHSFGGLFGSYLLNDRPTIFTHYLLVAWTGVG